MNIDLTQICIAILSLIGVVFTSVVYPLLKQKLSDKQLQAIRDAVDIGIYSAQMIFGDKDGERKKEHAIATATAELDRRGIQIDLGILSDYIEAGVRKMKNELDAIAATSGKTE